MITKTKLTEIKFQTMLDLQDQMNNKVNKDWRNAGYNWADAIFTEGSEAFEHSAWKWWKDVKTGPNLAQIKLEVIDIWHFLLSEIMTFESNSETITHFDLVNHVIKLVDDAEPPGLIKDTFALQGCLRHLVHMATSENDDARIGNLIAAFYMVMNILSMDWDEVYKLYIGKNVLNMFRQANGYKEGTYTKIWNGKEDNEVLTSLVAGMNVESPTFVAELNGALGAKYGLLSLLMPERGTEYANT